MMNNANGWLALLCNIRLSIFLIGLFFFPACIFNKQQAPRADKKLPSDLIYKRKPIANSCMKELVPLCGIPEPMEIDLDTFTLTSQYAGDEYNDLPPLEEDEFEWKYVGTLANGDHIIYTYFWPALASGKFTQFVILRRENNILKAIAWIGKGSNHATMINSGTLENDTLTYYQNMTSGSLFQELMELYPDLSKSAHNKDTEGFGWGEPCCIGSAVFQVTILPNGTLKNRRIKSFGRAFDGRKYSKSDALKSYEEWKNENKPLSLAMGDAFEQLLNIHACHTEVGEEQLKNIIKEVCTYAKPSPKPGRFCYCCNCT